ncbi:hypothetical protein [Acidihalobacter prosperus]|uniref:Uncharacterized protein n=1 Tax=Acidihalobacter prosperus TaxID=160660 RepID=A0A1A6C0F9_9GAMM|nr:hypothetical protein [Acidihalobacter prosperus]OBS08041.1 hypothetical protein Thpro_022291 [Acidihalobacter prosperus]
MQAIRGRMIINVMRGCLSEVSATLKSLRAQLAERDEGDALRNGLLFSLDMNLAAIHLLGIRLMEAESAGEVTLSGAERVVLGMAGSFMAEPVARLIDDALEGFAVPDERVGRELGRAAPGGRLQ